MSKIACIGEAMIELSMGEDSPQVGVAGDTLNTAIYLKRSAPELSVDYITCLGDDPFSQRIMAFIDAQDLGTGAIQTLTDASPGLYAITTTPDGERSFTYWRSNSAARQTFADGDFEFLNSYDAIYLSGISLAILSHTIRLALLKWLSGTPIKLIYDSNYRARLWESVENARLVTTAMWERADFALPSIDDEMELFEQSAKEVVARFSAHAGQGALKRGAEGPISIGSDVTQSYASAPNVIDTTAAGDSFNGGYLSGVLTGKSQAEALLRGHDLAARVVQNRGAIIPR